MEKTTERKYLSTLIQMMIAREKKDNGNTRKLGFPGDKTSWLDSITIECGAIMLWYNSDRDTKVVWIDL